MALVDPSDRNTLLEAIQINSFLWGGLHNPIVPAYRKTPATWSDLPLEPPAHCAEVANTVICWKGLSPIHGSALSNDAYSPRTRKLGPNLGPTGFVPGTKRQI
jgi:hypothetical protein